LGFDGVMIGYPAHVGQPVAEPVLPPDRAARLAVAQLVPDVDGFGFEITRGGVGLRVNDFRFGGVR